MPNPKLTEASPRLSTVLHPFQSRMKCQRCSHAGPDVSGWQEHDHHDKPEPIYIFLCKSCGKMMIGSHPRLYRQIWPNEPLPGIMDICENCPHRKRSRCDCPLAVFNGGPEPGIQITIERPTQAHIHCSGGRGGWRQIYTSPATNCSGKTTRQ